MAGRQHGAISARQLLEAGFSREKVKRWARQGLLHREYRGVYRLGHRAPSVEAHYMAAVLACGDGAVLSGAAAAHLLGLLKGRPPAPEVTTTADRRVRGVMTHRARSLDPSDATTWRGIPITTPARTLVDLAAVLSLDALARAAHEAEIRHRLSPAGVEETLARRRGAPGAAKLRAVVAGDARVLLSVLERAFLALLREHGLPLPQTNVRAGSHHVDCRWPEHRLTVELDSYRYHRSRHAWEQDRRREREARERGDEHRRYTYTDVVEYPAGLLRDLPPLLGFPAISLTGRR